MILNETVALNTTSDVTEDFDIELVHSIGALAFSVSVIMNGLLLTCVYVNRNKSWIKKRSEYTSLIASDFVTGMAVIVVFAARHATSEAPAKVLCRVEEAIYFISKCVTINHLLLMCLNKIVNSWKQRERQMSSFHIQSLIIWLITLSWLVFPFILLNNDCSSFWFAECTVLEQGPSLMLQFLSFMFGFPLVSVNIVFSVYLILSYRKYYSKKHSETKLHQQKLRSSRNVIKKNYNTYSIHDEKVNGEMLIMNKLIDVGFVEADKPSEMDFAEDSLQTLGTNDCIVHCDSFSGTLGKKKQKKVEFQNKRTTITIGLMLLVLDVSVWSIVASFVTRAFKTGPTLPQSVVILTFCNQLVYPLIYILTIPGMRMTLKKMFHLCSSSSFSRKSMPKSSSVPRQNSEVRMVCRFKAIPSEDSSSLCSCQNQHMRRERAGTADSILGKVLKQKLNGANTASLRARYNKPDHSLSHSFGDVRRCAHGLNQSVYRARSAGSRDILRSRQQSVSGRSVISGGFSIEMDSQLSISDILSCQV